MFKRVPKERQLRVSKIIKFCSWVLNSLKRDVNLKLRLNEAVTLSKEDVFKESTNISDPGTCATLASTRKDMALSAISMNSALADKEFVLSLHHKLHVSTCINKPNDVHKHNQSIFHSINQSFLHKQQ